MKKIIAFAVALALVFVLPACTVKNLIDEQGAAETAATSQTEPTESDPEQISPPSDSTRPSMPEVGQDPGGFGPIF